MENHVVTMSCCKRWVCEEHPELKLALGDLLDSYDGDKYESMAKVVEAYNRAVKI